MILLLQEFDLSKQPLIPPIPEGLTESHAARVQGLVDSPLLQMLARCGHRFSWGRGEDGSVDLTIRRPDWDELAARLDRCPDEAPGGVDTVPTSFQIEAYAGRWFHWSDIATCFWPGRGQRAEALNADLAPVRSMGGVYCFATARKAPTVLGPKAKQVRYIGQTANFFKRMSQFAKSAGFWGERKAGHSGAKRWPEGRTADTWVSFFPVTGGLQPHLATGLRVWMEAVALEEHFQ